MCGSFRTHCRTLQRKGKGCVGLSEHIAGLCRGKERSVGIFQDTVKDFVERSEGMCVSSLSEHSEGFFF